MGKVVFCFIASLLLSFVALSFVSAADTTSVPSPGQVASNIGNGISNIFNGDGSFLNAFLNFNNIGFAKILIFFLIALIIYAISDFIPYISQHVYVKWAISIIIGLLATLYLNAQDVYTVIVSYSALGITLTAIIPFILIAIISKKEHEEGRNFTSKLLWIIFIVVLVMKIIGSWSSVGINGQWIYIIVLILAGIMFLWDNKIYFFLFRQQVKNARESANAEALAQVTSELEEIREQILSAPNETIAKPLKAKWNRLVKRQNELGGNYREWQSF